MVFQGSCVALITPFTETGVDFEALGRLIEFQIANGTNAILIAGTTGEPSTSTATLPSSSFAATLSGRSELPTVGYSGILSSWIKIST